MSSVTLDLEVVEGEEVPGPASPGTGATLQGVRVSPAPVRRAAVRPGRMVHLEVAKS